MRHWNWELIHLHEMLQAHFVSNQLIGEMQTMQWNFIWAAASFQAATNAFSLRPPKFHARSCFQLNKERKIETAGKTVDRNRWDNEEWKMKGMDGILYKSLFDYFTTYMVVTKEKRAQLTMFHDRWKCCFIKFHRHYHARFKWKSMQS
jgi:hypothetical protein